MTRRASLIFAVGILLLSVTGYGLWHFDYVKKRASTSQPASTGISHVQTASQQPMNTPALLRIPKLGITAKVQAVGLNAQGNMGAPRNLLDVAWFKTGTVPGNPGNAVIAGHFGRPHQTAFWNLSSLQTGDKIEVIDTARNKAQFRVTGAQHAAPDLATRDHIFGQTNETHLNLITCDGTWDEASKSYDERLIVFSTRVK